MNLKDYIADWIVSYLAVPSSAFNNLPPCPYAKQAWLDNKVYITADSVGAEYKQLLDRYEVIIYAFDPKEISSEDLSNLAASLSDEKIVALDDHPDHEESVGDVILNNGKYALLLVQERTKLNKARKILKSKGYYDSWSPQYLNEVLSL
jgi:hypothetical protein